MTYEIPLLVSAVVFAAFLAFKFRPAVGHEGRVNAAALVEAKKRLEAAKDDAARAVALGDAAEASANLGRVDGATAYFLRAFRADPASVEIVERAAKALARRPNALEKLMWRHLGLGPGEGASRRAATLATLKVLSQVYGRKPRTRVRQQAVEHLLSLLS